MEFRGGSSEAAAQLIGVGDRSPEGVAGERGEVGGHEGEGGEEQIEVALPCTPVRARVAEAGHQGREETNEAHNTNNSTHTEPTGGPQDEEGQGRKGRGGDDVDDEGGDGDDGEEKEMSDEISGGRARGGARLPDRWVCRGRNMTWTREHRAPRSELFHPTEADRGPTDLTKLWCVRRTKGVMKDGRRFDITDDWTRRNDNKVNELRQSWTGQTTFIMRTPQGKLEKMQVPGK